MGEASFVHSSFLGGEWSKTSQGRIDLPAYKTAMNVCLNGLPLESASWTRRPGFRHSAHTRGGAFARAITFSFQESAPYTMEFTNGHLRFHTNNRLATTNDALAVTGISTANPAVVNVPANTWLTGDTVVFSVLGTGDPTLLNRQFLITVINTTHFSLADALTGIAIDGAAFATTTGATVSRIKEVVVPYLTADLLAIRSIQAETKAILLHGTYAPQVLTAVAPVGSADATFSLSPAQFFDGPYLDPVIGAVLTPASASGIVGFTITSPAYSSTAVYNFGDFVLSSSIVYKSLIDQNLNNTPASSTFAWAVVTQDKVVGPSGLVSSDIGRHVRLLSEPLAWAIGTTYAAGDSVKYNGAYWTAVVGTNTGNRPGLDLTKWAINVNAALWTWGRVTSLTGAVATIISPAAGTAFASPTNPNNLAQAFDGITDQVQFSALYHNVSNDKQNRAVGKNFTGSAKAISYAIITAPSDHGFAEWHFSADTGFLVTINLRGNSSAPSTTSDGTLLGSVTTHGKLAGETFQIFSNDTSTTFNYIWVELVFSDPIDRYTIAEIQFYTTTAFSGTGISVQILGPALLYTTTITTWRLGLFTSAAGYPKCGTYHEGRLWLSGFTSNRLDASALVDVSGNPANDLFYFTPTLKDGTVSAACAINYTLKGPDVNAVFWLKPNQQGISIGTQAGEWLVKATDQNNIITPLSMQARRVTTLGCANIDPAQTDHTLAIVQAFKHQVMEYFPDVFSGKFAAPNLSEFASHLGSRGIEEVVYQKGLIKSLWARCTDGSLIGAVYKRDSLMQSQGPSFIGWHRHTLGSGRVIESMCVGPSPANATNAAGLLDTLCVVTTDTATGIRHVEFLVNPFEETSSGSDAWYLDNAVVPAVSQNIVLGGNSTMQCTGLWHLNGKTVSVFAGGIDCGDHLVTNGKLNVIYGSDPAGLFTAAFVSGYSGTLPVVVGFTYTSDGQLVPPDMQQEAGTRSGPGFGRISRVHECMARLVNTQGIYFGTSFTGLHLANFQTPGGTAYAKNALFTGVHWDKVEDPYNRDGSMLCWRITRPYPATVAAIGGVIQTQG